MGFTGASLLQIAERRGRKVIEGAYRIVQVEGGRLEDVQLRLRHATLQTTDEVYSHLVPR